MNTEALICTMFCKIDDKMKGIPKHAQASLFPSEIVTLGCLFALKGKGTRAFYRWVRDNYRHLFPKLPHRTRLFRLFATHRDWSARLLADPTVFGVIDAYGIESPHPRGTERPPNRQERHLQPSLDCGRKTLPSAE